MNAKITTKKIAFYVGIVVVWQVIFLLHIIPEQAFPSPFQVAKTLVHEIANGSLPYGIATSLWRLIVGLAIELRVVWCLEFLWLK